MAHSLQVLMQIVGAGWARVQLRWVTELDHHTVAYESALLARTALCPYLSNFKNLKWVSFNMM